jgi:RNA polymerase sigma factor (sigma-70 family)
VATDAQVVARVLRGDAQAYALLIQRHQASVIAAAHHLTGDPEAARDLAQEAFIDAYRSLGQLRRPDSFAGWLLGILRNKCRRFLSRRAPDSVPLDEAPAPSTAEPEPQEGPLIELLAQLPLADREILAARYISELSYSDIARMLETTVNNVRVRCCRARQRLRRLFEQAQSQAAQAGEAP